MYTCIHFERGRAIIATAREFHILHRHGQPGARKSYAFVESSNRDILVCARNVFHAAVLPVCFWPFVVRYVRLPDR
eukprot:5344910-Lingulodinium_polyedra.AAC.1